MFATGLHNGNAAQPLNLYYGVCFRGDAAHLDLRVLKPPGFILFFKAERVAGRRSALLIALFSTDADRTKHTFPSLMYLCHLKMAQPLCLQIPPVNLVHMVWAERVLGNDLGQDEGDEGR